MCSWSTEYVVESSDTDPLILAHKSNETMDPMLSNHIRERHSSFHDLFEAARKEGIPVSNSDTSMLNDFRGSFNVTHREIKITDEDR